MRTSLSYFALLAAIAASLLSFPSASAQTDTAVVAGPEYPAGSLHETLLGKEYRDLWTTPVRVPILDLDTFAGGLTPVRRGGGNQTISLRFEGQNGQEYNFRSVNKEITKGLPDWLKETLVDWVLQDQTSSLHPGAAGLAAAILDSVNVLNPGPRLIVLPDDRRLGEFRKEFAGRLGWIEIHPDENRETPRHSFAGAVRVAGTDRVLEHLAESADHRVDSRAYLRARLMALFLGDWDRHQGQFRWARYDRAGVHWWVPVPEDRDYAFVSYDGVLPRLARQTFVPRAHPYRAAFRENLLPLVISAEELDRRILAELHWEVWDSVAGHLQERLSDAAIGDALRRMPQAWYAESGARLYAILRGRRDRLHKAAEQFYGLVMQAPEVHATDEPDWADVERLSGGEVRVRLAALQEGSAPVPYFDRTFQPNATREIRLYLHGGNDRLIVRGSVPKSIRLQVVGGAGDDVLADSSRVGSNKARAMFYDSQGENRIVRGPDTGVDTRTYRAVSRTTKTLSLPPRDWGSSRSWFAPWADYRGHAGGLVIGGGPSYTRYGFRQWPYAYRLAARGMLAPGSGRIGIALQGDFRLSGSSEYLTVHAHASQLEAFWFHGFGNETAFGAPSYGHLASPTELLLDAMYHLRPFQRVRLAVGPTFKWTDAKLKPGSASGSFGPDGGEPFGQVGVRSELVIDTRDEPSFPSRGLRLDLGGTAYREHWDAAGSFGSLRAAVASYARLPPLQGAVLALRAGGERAFGRFPVHEAAFLGGSPSIRGYAYRQFAGDAALYGNSEVRVPLTEANLIVRGTLGVSALLDAGRVYYRGTSEGGWHTAAGGSLWFATPGPVVNVSYARGELGQLYVGLGMPF